MFLEIFWASLKSEMLNVLQSDKLKNSWPIYTFIYVSQCRLEKVSFDFFCKHKLYLAEKEQNLYIISFKIIHFLINESLKNSMSILQTIAKATSNKLKKFLLLPCCKVYVIFKQSESHFSFSNKLHFSVF
jgi:hypothetical protein